MQLDANVESAAQEFALKLRQAPPIVEFWRAKERMEADEGAQRLLAELQDQQRRLLLKQQNGGDISQEEIDALRRLQREAQTHPLISAYFRAQQIAQSYLPDVNYEISQILGFDFGALSGAGAGSC